MSECPLTEFHKSLCVGTLFVWCTIRLATIRHRSIWEAEMIRKNRSELAIHETAPPRQATSINCIHQALTLFARNLDHWTVLSMGWYNLIVGQFMYLIGSGGSEKQRKLAKPTVSLYKQPIRSESAIEANLNLQLISDYAWWMNSVHTSGASLEAGELKALKFIQMEISLFHFINGSQSQHPNCCANWARPLGLATARLANYWTKII